MFLKILLTIFLICIFFYLAKTMALIIFFSPHPQDFQIYLVPVRMSGQGFLVFGPIIAANYGL